MGDNQGHPTQPLRAKWLYSRDGAEYGPFTSQHLQAMTTRGELLPAETSAFVQSHGPESRGRVEGGLRRNLKNNEGTDRPETTRATL